ncbi:hypothetical protein QYF36_006255 [Acer negundo]|nr:hypothetical protein QYF36_006255 [Acer negundo]
MQSMEIQPSMETAGLAEEFGVGEALTGDGADERGGGARAKETDVWVDRERERGVWMKKMFGERGCLPVFNDTQKQKSDGSDFSTSKNFKWVIGDGPLDIEVN